jgi:hypothetical protein
MPAIHCTAVFTDDTAELATDSYPAIASHKLQTNLLGIQNWFKKWRMKASGPTLHSLHEEKRATPVYINNVQLPQEENVKYLGPRFTGYI